MSMTRQLWLSILASMLIALGVSLFASLLNAPFLPGIPARHEEPGQRHHPGPGPEPRQQRPGDGVVLAVTALFDGGHYDLIQVVDPRGGSLVDKVAPPTDTGVPGLVHAPAAHPLPCPAAPRSPAAGSPSAPSP
jgi:hypothetical protein